MENKFILDPETFLPKESVFYGYRGSIAHGTCDITMTDSIDDIDYFAVTMPDKKYYYGLSEYGSRGTKEIVFDTPLYDRQITIDCVCYDMRKYFSLLMKGNPNVHCWLWTREDFVQIKTGVGYMLLMHKDMFLSKEIYHSYIGYSKAQMSALLRAKRGCRKELVEKFGYDTKNASHCIRLLRMCKETLRDGKFYVDRSQIDALDLLSIKRGNRKLEHVQEEYVQLLSECEQLVRKCDLPNEVDKEKAEKLLIDMYDLYWSYGK